MRVLIAEDSQIMRKIIKTNLKKMGVSDILEASDGEHALNAAKANTDIALLFTDLNMPVLSGLELCKALRGSGEFKKLKIIVISEFLGQNAKEAFLEIGVDGFVPKPFDLKAFNEVVTPIVESAKDPEGVVKKGMDISKADFVEKIKAETPNVELNPQELTITFNEMSVTVPVDKILEVGKITPKDDPEYVELKDK